MQTFTIDGHILARFWEVGIRTIQNYSNPSKYNPPLPKIDKNKYDFVEANRWMYKMQKEKIENLFRDGDEKVSDLKREHQTMVNKKIELELKKVMYQQVDKKMTLIAWTNLINIIKNNDTQLMFGLKRDLEGITDEIKKAEIIENGFAEKDRQLGKAEIIKYILNEELIFEDDG